MFIKREPRVVQWLYYPVISVSTGLDNAPSLTVYLIMRQPFGGGDKNAFYFLWSQPRVCLEHLGDDRGNDRRRERRAVDVLVMFCDDVLASDLERYDLPDAVYRPVERRIKLGVNAGMSDSIIV